MRYARMYSDPADGFLSNQSGSGPRKSAKSV